MSKAEQGQDVKSLNERIQQMEADLAEREQDCHGYRAACEQAEGRVRCLREELEDAQRENLQLRGWQECAREILMGSQASTSNPALRVVK
jgi:hypothetical protein